MKASDPIAAKNEEILAHVESVGGGYVWEPEFFAVTLFDVPVTDSEISSLSELRGVQQIALNASNLSFPAIESIAHIPALQSLVLCKHTLSAEQLRHCVVSAPRLIWCRMRPNNSFKPKPLRGSA